MTWEDYKKLLEEKGLKVGDNEKVLKEAFEKFGTTAFESKKEELEKELKQKLESSNSGDGDSETVLALKAEINDLKDLLGDMKKDRDASVEAQKEKLANEKNAKIEELKKQGIKDGKITEANWTEKWKAIAEKDHAQFETILSGLAVDPHAKKAQEDGSDEGGSETKYRGPLSGADPTMLEAMNKMDN